MNEVIFIKKTHLCSNIWTFYFSPKHEQHIAGQFIELINPTLQEKNEKKRWFTLSSSPTEEYLSITTRIDRDKHESNFKRALFSARPGQKFLMSSPMGDFVLIKNKATPLAFVAAGIGITPFRSMLRYLHDTKEQRDINLISLVHDPEDQAFSDEITSYGCNFNQMVSADKKKHIDIDKLISKFPSKNPVIYLSGPELFVEELRDNLINEGIEASRLITDYFPGYDN